jgi:hypothetical protein
MCQTVDHRQSAWGLTHYGNVIAHRTQAVLWPTRVGLYTRLVREGLYLGKTFSVADIQSERCDRPHSMVNPVFTEYCEEHTEKCTERCTEPHPKTQ